MLSVTMVMDEEARSELFPDCERGMPFGELCSLDETLAAHCAVYAESTVALEHLGGIFTLDKDFLRIALMTEPSVFQCHAVS